ncbi:hypothetical protein FHG87_010216 [Trinorchestia longiramus]|nr:hypothetical protein FHG87_010216 [Trinorchestia longiramus]
MGFHLECDSSQFNSLGDIMQTSIEERIGVEVKEGVGVKGEVGVKEGVKEGVEDVERRVEGAVDARAVEEE